MKNGIIVDTSYFDGVDLDRPAIKPAIIEKLQANAKKQAQNSQSQNHQTQKRLDDFFDNDVQALVKQHNSPQDRIRLNNAIRALYGVG